MSWREVQPKPSEEKTYRFEGTKVMIKVTSSDYFLMPDGNPLNYTKSMNLGPVFPREELMDELKKLGIYKLPPIPKPKKSPRTDEKPRAY